MYYELFFAQNGQKNTGHLKSVSQKQRPRMLPRFLRQLLVYRFAFSASYGTDGVQRPFAKHSEGVRHLVPACPA